MTRDSRFDKLELERKKSGAASDASSPSGLRRFEDEPEHRSESTENPTVLEPNVDIGPIEKLKRFEEDGAAVLQLDRDVLADAAMLECPSCHRESSKWDKACIYCGVSLISREAVAYNVQLVESKRLAKEIEVENEQARHQAAIAKQANEQAEAILNEAREQSEAKLMIRRLVCSCIVPIALTGLWVASSYVVKLFFFFVFVVTLGGALSASAIASIRRHLRPRGRVD